MTVLGSLGHLPNQSSSSDLIAMESKITEISYLMDFSIFFSLNEKVNWDNNVYSCQALKTDWMVNSS